MSRTLTAAECPNCETPLTAGERRSGTCPSCRQPLGSQPTNGRTSAARQPRQSRMGRCELTGREVSDLTDAYVRVSRLKIGVGVGSVSAKSRWYTVSVRCSEAALRRGRAIKRDRVLLALAWMLPALILLPIAILLEQMGASRAVVGGIGIAGFLLPIPVMAAGPFLAGPMVRRRLRKLLDPAVDRRLRSLNDGAEWGVWSELLFVTKLDANETAIPLASIS